MSRTSKVVVVKPADATDDAARTTRKYALCILDAENVLLHASQHEVKSAIAKGKMMGTLVKVIRANGHSVKVDTITDAASGISISAGGMTLRYTLLWSWSQCPNCGAKAGTPTKGCVSCSESTVLTDSDKADLAESVK